MYLGSERQPEFCRALKYKENKNKNLSYLADARLSTMGTVHGSVIFLV
jgi:hypothetical protein